MMSISLDECRRALGAGTVVLWLAIVGTLSAGTVLIVPDSLEAQARQQRGGRSSGQPSRSGSANRKGPASSGSASSRQSASARSGNRSSTGNNQASRQPTGGASAGNRTPSNASNNRGRATGRPPTATTPNRGPATARGRTTARRRPAGRSRHRAGRWGHHRYHRNRSWYRSRWWARRWIRRAVFISWATKPTTVQTTTYYYYDGKYYTAAVQEGETVYVIISAPEGMELDELPPDAEEQEVQGQSYWYAENTFYQQIQRDGKAVYVVVDAPAGAVIPGLPEDAMEVEDEGDPVYQYDDTYYAAATSEESPTGGYVVQPAPPEETIDTIPADATYFDVDGVFYYYVDYGLYVLLEGGGYGASEPPLGGVAPQLPEGATVITEGGESYFQFDTVFFEMTSRDGSTVYVVIPAPDGSEIVE